MFPRQHAGARRAIASRASNRWGKRDAFGQALLAATDELSAPDDKTIIFKLKRPFPLLPDALGKAGVSICPVMPERLAKTDPFKQVTEMVGSGPVSVFVANERVPGAKVAYEKFAGYVPRSRRHARSLTAGPKIAKFERIEWLDDPRRRYGARRACRAARPIGGSSRASTCFP